MTLKIRTINLISLQAKDNFVLSYSIILLKENLRIAFSDWKLT